MRLLDKGEPVINMGHCIICSQGIDLHVQTITVDTLYDSDLPAYDIMGGRKYVCQGCVFDLARVCGFARASEVADVQASLASFRVEYSSTMDAIRQSVMNAMNVAATLPLVPQIDFMYVPPVVVDAEEKLRPKRAQKSKTDVPF